MKTTRSIAKLLLACAFMMQTALAAEHHSGHGGAMGGGGGRSSCLKARLERFSPEPLATVPPDSAFSFYAFNVDSPEQISVTVKKIPVKFTSEYKDPFWVVRGQLPHSIDNTAARIDVKVKAKSPQCEAEKGWLIKISGRQ
ncbi:MAG: hypothetical protein ACU841_13960 [Gammaproteobacteria bacterium]